jgi:hypothetical protein
MSSFSQLYNSAIAAYPNTTRRQHATDTIKIENVRWTPFLGMNTLLLRVRADNTADNGGIYNPLILFKKVKYEGPIKIIASDNGQTNYISPLSLENNVLVRCSCGDLFWRFHHEDFQDRSLTGPDRKPYEAISNRGPINPTHAIGVCKHLIKTIWHLQEKGIIV